MLTTFPSNDFSSADSAPLFNIGAVTRMTGIPEATLRMWERRYDFPTSTRTAGGHRLYSQQEVTRLRWIKLRVDEGMQISRAIEALRLVEREGESFQAALWPSAPAPASPDSPETNLFRQRLIAALRRHDTHEADQVLSEAYMNFPVEDLVLDVIGPSLHTMGELWSVGEVDVATEHFSTHYLRARLLMWMRTGPPAYRVGPVVLACAPGELHEGSLLILGVLLRRLRWPIAYLGQSVPLAELAAFIHEVDAGVIVFVAMAEETALALADWPRWLPRAAETQRPIVAYGGRIFSEQPALAEQVPGVLLGRSLREGAETLDRMLHELNPLLK